jgi:hypothetical protein
MDRYHHLPPPKDYYTMKVPYAFRPMKAEYIAVAKLLQNDLYLKMDEKQFVTALMKETNGQMNPTRARQIWLNLCKDAGI